MQRLSTLFKKYLFLRRIMLWASGVGLGALLVIGGMSTMSQTEHMATWQAVEATVVRSESKPYDPLFLLPGENRDMPTYELDLLYSFREGNMDWVGSKVRWVPERFETESEAQAEAARYQPGDTITVYFDPDDPRESVIDPSADDLDSPITLAGFIIFFGSLAFLAVELVSVSKRRARAIHDPSESRRPESNR